MAWTKWFQSGRRLLAMFLAIALLLAGTLLRLGWQLASQDRQMALQRLQEARENAADLAVAALQKSISQAEERLATLPDLPLPELRPQAALLAAALPDDSLLAVLRGRTLEAFPERRLPFYPEGPAPAAPQEALFAEAEGLEFRGVDYPRALAALAKLAQSNDPAVRATANMRIARIYRKQGRWNDALAVYRQVLQLGGVPADGLPAELVARHARLGILERQKQEDAARQEAAGVLDILGDHRYRLSRGAYEFFTAEARRTPGAAGKKTDSASSLALAAATEALPEMEPTSPGQAGRRLVREAGQSFLVLWRGAHGGVNAILLGAKWVEAQWGSALGSVFSSQGVVIRLAHTDERPVLGTPVGKSAYETVRLAAATQLPWNLHVTTTRPELALAPLEVRRRWFIIALAVIAALILAGSYLVGRALNRELAVSRLQSDFVSAVSHEFRTPLTSLCLLSEQLDSGSVVDEGARSSYYRTLARESQRLRRLVEGLLNFGRLEAGAADYRFEVQDPAELVRDVARQFETDVQADGYRVEVQIDEDTPLVRADRAALVCAVWNLLDNAVKYSPDSRTVWACAGAENGRAAIRVRDRGLGIPSAEQGRIFDKFFRGEAAQRAGIRGTGVGLAMVRHIVAAHGGEVRLESGAGEGATFTVLLPAVS